jgi:hypothetical protein
LPQRRECGIEIANELGALNGDWRAQIDHTVDVLTHAAKHERREANRASQDGCKRRKT